MADEEPGGEGEGGSDGEGSLVYYDYLGLDDILAAQRLRTDAPDELLFVIQHQTTELWLKLVLHELQLAAAAVAADTLVGANKSLARVGRVLKILTDSWSALATLTPTDYGKFRGALDNGSGLQSAQWRALEFTLGNKNRAHLEHFRHRPAFVTQLTEALTRPSLYDRVVGLLAARGLPVAESMLDRDWSEPYRPDDSVTKAWLAVYQDPEAWADLYHLAEQMVDIEAAVRQWRFRHMTVVERVIGLKTGTAGTSGVGYLRRQLGAVLFPELWRVRTELG